MKALKMLFILFCVFFAKQTTYAQDFEVSVGFLAPEQDTTCIWDSLELNLEIRYSGTSTLSTNSGILMYYVDNGSGTPAFLKEEQITWPTFIVIPEAGIVISQYVDTIGISNQFFINNSDNIISVNFTANIEDSNPDNNSASDTTFINCELVDFETELEPFDDSQDTLCVGENLTINGGIRYNGGEAITVDTLYLNYYIGQEGANDNVETLTPVHQDTLLDRTFEPGEFVSRSLNYPIVDGELPSGVTGYVVLWPTTTRDYYLDTNPDNDVSIDSTAITCELIEVDFETELEPFDDSQDTLCVGEDLTINGGIRYNGSESVTVDTLYLNYYVGEEGGDGNVDDLIPVHQDTLLNRTFEPGEFVPRSLTYLIGGILPNGSTDYVVLWPTTTRDYLDTNPDNDVSVDSTVIACQLVDFETELEPFDDSQDTLCVGEDLTINGGIRYNGSESVTVDTLYLNYYVGEEGGDGNVDDLIPVHQDTLLNRTFEPGEFVPRSLTYLIGGILPNGSTDYVVLWPTTTRDYLDTNPDNDVSVDSTVIACQLVDFETELEPFDDSQDTLCVGEDLTINGGIRYNGSESVTVDTLYLNYYVGEEGGDGNVDDLTPVYTDTLLNRTFLPDEFVPRSLNYLLSGLPSGSTDYVVLWPTTTRDYLDTNPDNDVSVDSTVITCELIEVDFETELEPFDDSQDTLCVGENLIINGGIRYNGSEAVTVDTLYLNYYVGEEGGDGNVDGLTPVHQDTLLNRTFEPGEFVPRSLTYLIGGILPNGSTDYVVLWPTTTRDYLDTNPDNDVSVDSTVIACQLVDFETELEPFDDSQDTLCVGEDLTINGGIRYNGSESVTVDTLYLNYYVGEEGGDGNVDGLTPVHQDTLLNRTFEPGEFVPRSLTYLIGGILPNGSTDYVVLWPTTTRDYLDTNPDNDVSVDSTVIACQLVDFETELEPFDDSQDTLCVGEDLTINGGIRYNGSESVTVDTLYLNYYVGEEGGDGNVDDLIPVHQDTLLNRTFEPGEFVPRSLTYLIGGILPNGSTDYVVLWPTTTRDYLDTNPDNDVSVDSTVIACQLVDFETELEPFDDSQDTLCVGEDLMINGGIRYNGSESVTVDTLYLNYYVGEEGGDGNVDGLTPVHQDTLLNRTFEPGEFVPRSLTYLIGGILPNGSTDYVVLWPTTTRDYLDTNPDNDVSVDSTVIACQLVDFETELEPFDDSQDTLCVGEDLMINGGIRYNGSESVTVDTLYLNYYVGEEGGDGNVDGLTPVHQDTLLNRTFEPGEFVPRSLTYLIGGILPNGSTDYVVLWPTTTRDYLDTNPDNDVSVDSTVIACQLVDFETELEPFDDSQDTLCVGEDLTINGGIRYNGSESVTVDTLYLNYYVGQEGGDGNVDNLTPVHQDTLLNRTFEPGEFVPRSLTYLIGGLPSGSTDYVVLWPTTTRDYLDTNPDNDVSVDSTLIACQLVDFEINIEPFSPNQDTICLGDTLTINGSVRYHGEEPVTIDTLYLEYYLGSAWNGETEGLIAEFQDTLINHTFQPNEEIEWVRPLPVVAPLFVQGSTGFVLIWPTTTGGFEDSNLSNNMAADSLSVECIPNLPLNLISFIGGYVDKEVELNWKVSQWNEGNYFDIERSNDGLNFEFIDKINAIANEQANTYRYRDDNPYFTTTYYRLKMVDINGAAKYSPTLAVKKEHQQTLSIDNIYLDDNQLNLTYSSTDSSHLTASLYDSMGRLIYREVITSAQVGFNEYKIDVKGLNVGAYVLSLQSENELVSRIFIR